MLKHGGKEFNPLFYRLKFKKVHNFIEFSPSPWSRNSTWAMGINRPSVIIPRMFADKSAEDLRRRALARATTTHHYAAHARTWDEPLWLEEFHFRAFSSNKYIISLGRAIPWSESRISLARFFEVAIMARAIMATCQNDELFYIKLMDRSYQGLTE